MTPPRLDEAVVRAKLDAIGTALDTLESLGRVDSGRLRGEPIVASTGHGPRIRLSASMILMSRTAPSPKTPRASWYASPS